MIEWKVNVRSSHKHWVKLNEVWSSTRHGRRVELQYAAVDWLGNYFLSNFPSFSDILWKPKATLTYLNLTVNPTDGLLKPLTIFVQLTQRKGPLVTVTSVMSEGKKRKNAVTPSEESLPLLWPMERCTAREKKMPVRDVLPCQPVGWVIITHLST